MLPGILLDVSGDDGCSWREQQPTAFISGATQHAHSDNGTAAHQPVTAANDDSPVATSSPVAICSMAVRLPGGVNSPSDFWRFLVNKGDGACKVPADRYNIDAYSSKIHKSGTIQTERGYYLNHLDLAHFDAAMFSLTKSEVEKLDPQHRLLLELTRECLEGAGETNWRGSSTGCYIGTFGEDWLQIQSRDTLESTRNRVTGYSDYLLSNRISYEYDFRGPSLTLKTACSSSLTGLDLACKALQAGEISAAVVGGANLIMSPSLSQALTEQGVLSPSGTCRSFDADADGYVRAEAVNMVYLKRLDDALRDGNPIRAVIRATASNFDGKTPGIAQPSSSSQEDLIRACYRSAQLTDFGDTTFVECHGTGTATGDPIEASAVANVFGDKGVYIGSVKSNIGHSEGAAGLSALIKATLALENSMIPPNINFNRPNPNIPWKRGQLVVPTEPTPWPRTRHQRASVNSFGIGGSNCHVILDSTASLALGEKTSTISDGVPRLAVYSSNDGNCAKSGLDVLQQHLEKQQVEVADLAYTLGTRREHHAHRSFAVIDGLTQPVFSAPSKVPKVSPEVAFAFTGQGAQWATMGASLIADYPSVALDMDSMDLALSRLPEPPAWTLQWELQKLKDDSRVDKAEFSQPLCTAVQIAVVNLLRRWNINPISVVGHSSGEIAAAYACGALTMDEAIVVAYLRGLAFTKQAIRPGGMAAIGLGREAVIPFLRGDAVIACENSPQSVTLAGDVEGLNKVMARIKEDSPDVFARRLKVEMAFHSPYMKEAGQTFARMLGSKVSSRAPAIPMFSSQTNNVIRSKNAVNGPYWQSSYDNPVLFNTVLQKLILSRSVNAAPLMLVEIGPHSALAGPIRQIIKKCQRDVSYIPTLVRGEDATHNLLTAAGKLFLKGVKLDFQAVNRGGRVLADLPSYSWNHSTRYWDEGRLSKQWRLREFAHHDLLGSRIADSGDLQPAWRNLLRLVDIPWCRDHVIAGDIVFPGAGYVAMAVEAMRQISGGADDFGFTLRSVSLLAALTMNETAAIETVLTMRHLRLTDSLDDSSWYEFSIMSFSKGTASWTKHCTGQARQGREQEVESTHIVDLPRKVQSSAWYRVLKKAGMNYGPAFQGLEHLSAHPVTNSAVAHVSNASGPADSAYQLHPSTLDACIQLFTTAACRGQARSFSTVPYVPTWIGEVYVKLPQDEIVVRADATFGQKGAIDGTCIGFSGDDPTVVLKDVKMSPLGDAGSSRGDDPHAGVTLSWMPDLSLTTIDRLEDYELSQDHQQWLRLLAHKKPDMSILSFGSFAEETTPAHLSALTSEFGERMFSSLTIIDNTCEDRGDLVTSSYSDVPGVTVVAVDTEQEVAEWQMDHTSADLIFLTEDFDTSVDRIKMLSKLQTLLKPDGRLILRTCDSLLTSDGCNVELHGAGFTPAEACILETVSDSRQLLTIMASPARCVEDYSSSGSVSLLSKFPQGKIATLVRQALERTGLNVELVSLTDVPQHDIISILDLDQDQSFISELRPEQFAQFQAFMEILSGRGLLWLTKSCQMTCHEPQYARIIGLARTLRNEQALDFATLELDDVCSETTKDAICKVFGAFRRRDANLKRCFDFEHAIAGGVVYVPRFHWMHVGRSLTVEPSTETPSKRLEMEKQGSLKSLRWVEQPIAAPPFGNEVLVQVRAVGINFKDVLVSMGIVEGDTIDRKGLGCECSGVIQAIGPDVQDLQVGDRVFVAGSNTYSTLLRTTADHCAKIPDSLPYSDAATMPCVYGTVVHGLLELAQLEAGQSVLIHSACGGVGTAAINICRMIGAKIYATVGNQEKVEHLVKNFGIPRENIYNSRNIDFLHQIKRATNGRGVNVALNSLSGDLLHATWECVAEFGSMVEIGKRDFIGNGRLAMASFAANRSFFGVDLAHMCAHRPRKIKSLLNKIVGFYNEGAIQPIRPTTCYEASQYEEAFRSMQKGQNFGKLVLQIPEDPALPAAVPARLRTTFRSDATYLLVGGLGGLGRSVAVWMAENGARNLAFLSRSANTACSDTAAFIDELSALGCDTQVIAGDVTRLEDVYRVKDESLFPVAGVIQMSMVLRDGLFAQSTHEDWHVVAAPKVEGTWNLHKAFSKDDLDFFVMFGSISGVVGNPGQASYASANTFLDAFTHFRHNEGMAASVLDIGAMGDVGFVSQNQSVMDHLSAKFGYILQEQDLLDGLELAIKHSRPSPQTKLSTLKGIVNSSQIGLGFRMSLPSTAPENKAVWKNDTRMSIYRNNDSTASAGTDDQASRRSSGDDPLKVLLATASSDPAFLKAQSSIDIMAAYIGATLFDFMMRPLEDLDVKMSPKSLGMDSLVAIELKNWFKQRVGVEVGVLEIMSAGSMEQLGAGVLEKIAGRLTGKGGQ